MKTILMIAEIVVSIAIIAVVLMQKNLDSGLGFIGGASEQLSGNKVRGADTALRKITVALAVVFFVLAIVLVALQK